jgi:hypothetical protein
MIGNFPRKRGLLQADNQGIVNIPGSCGKILPGAFMIGSDSEDIKSAAALEFPSGEWVREGDGSIVAYVEVDRYCPTCAYNLRTQPVRRDGPTKLLVARCPECGSFDAVANTMTASKPWLSRLAMLALVIWILVLLWSIFGLSVAQGAVNYAMLEQFTTWQQIAQPAPALGNTRPNYQRVLRSDYLSRDYGLVMSIAVFGSFALAFILVALLVVACHHWHRLVFVCFALIHTSVVSAFVWQAWKYDVPALFDWGKSYIIGFMIVRLIGALAAVWAGRPLARLTVRVFLPPRIRSTLAFLWLADGLDAPRRETPAASVGTPAAGA